jgi:predicted phage terminase large subunit-like protein
MRAASKPGGPGHAFVKRRFGIEGRVQQPIFLPEASRLFIPSRLEDNEHLDREQYRESLQELDPFTRSQLESGDWSEYAGSYFRREWCRVLDHEPADVEKKVRAWDFAATEAKPGCDPDWSVGTLIGRTKQKQYILLGGQRVRATPLRVEQLVRQTAERDGRAVPVIMEEEAGSSGKIVSDHYRRVVLPGFVVTPVRSTGKKAERFAPFSSMAEAGNVFILRGSWNGPWLDELCAFDGSGKGHDDQCDSVSLGFAQLCKRQEFWVMVDGEIVGPERGELDGKPRIVPPEELDQWLKDARAAAAKEKEKPATRFRIDADAPGWVNIAGGPRGFGRR